MTYIYDPNTKTNDKGQVVVVCDQQTTMSEYEELKPAYKRVYTDQFSVEFLNSFFKSMEKSSIWINLTDKDGPMIVHYGLGNESYMRLVLAPRRTLNKQRQPTACQAPMSDERQSYTWAERWWGIITRSCNGRSNVLAMSSSDNVKGRSKR